MFAEKLQVAKNDSIFEVGCGAGAFLYLFYKWGHKVGGIDYSERLINIAQNAMSGMEFDSYEAKDIDISKMYDNVISNSVFHYFNNYDYACEVVNRMLKKAKKAIAILEVPNRELMEESEKARRGAMPAGEYEKKYNGLRHLYYDKSWFHAISRDLGYKIEIFDQNIMNYGNAKYRFNVIMRKNG